MTKRSMLSLLVLLTGPILGISQTPPDESPSIILSKKYSWQKPEQKQGRHILMTQIFAGAAHDFAYLEMDACSLLPSRDKTFFQVPADEEYLLLIKSGVLDITFRDSTWSVGPGSIALLMAGEKVSMQNENNAPANYYLMRYRSREPVDLARGQSSGGSFVKDWKKLTFRIHDRGGVRAYFEKSTSMCKRFEMHVTTLKPGLKSHDPHVHRAEEIILMLEDADEGRSHTEMLIGENSFRGTAGDLYYVGTGLLHGIKNIGTTSCSYFAFQFE